MARRKGTLEQRELQRSEDEEIRRHEKASAVEEIYLMDAGTLIDRSSTETPFVIDQIIPDEGICFLAGKPGSMKSWLAYDAALAVCRGRPWLGFDVPKAGNVLVLNFDNPSHELGRRFVRLGLKREDKIMFHSPAATLPREGLPAMLQLPDSLTALQLIMIRLRPMLVLVDSYRQSHTGDEHSSRDMGRIMSCLRSLTGYGASILVLHHLRKQGQQKDDVDDEPLRGSTEIQASADTILIVKGDTITFNKTRGWRTAIQEIRFLVDDPTETTTSISAKTDMTMLIALLTQQNEEGDEDGLTRKKIGEMLGIQQKICAKLINTALKQGIVGELPRKNAETTRRIELITPENQHKYQDKKKKKDQGHDELSNDLDDENDTENIDDDYDDD